MDSSRAQRLLLLAWLGAVGVQVANQITTAASSGAQCTTAYFVPPHKLLASAVVFSGLFAVAEFAAPLALAMGAGVDLLLLIGPMVNPPAGSSGQAQTLFDKLATLIQAST